MGTRKVRVWLSDVTYVIARGSEDRNLLALQRAQHHHGEYSFFLDAIGIPPCFCRPSMESIRFGTLRDDVLYSRQVNGASGSPIRHKLRWH